MPKYILALALTCLICSGCYKSLVVTNIGEYKEGEFLQLGKPASIGLVTKGEYLVAGEIFEEISFSLDRASVNAVYPFSPKNGRKVDYVVHIDIKASYEGSGWNYLITFPGALILTGTWHGYVYKASYAVDVTIKDFANRKKLDKFSIPIKLDLRHAEMDRTWTEFLTPLGVVFGAFFIAYDDDVTPLIGPKVRDPIGDYIAQEIVRRINKYRKKVK